MNKIFHLLILGLLSLPVPVVADGHRVTPDYLANDIQHILTVVGTGIAHLGANADNGVINEFTRNSIETQRRNSNLNTGNETTGQVRIVSGKQLNKYIEVRF